MFTYPNSRQTCLVEYMDRDEALAAAGLQEVA